tara:strand:+ start:26 stop:3835 length:3810 start_codon:yes stop_codon:yes gene_type:complete
MTSSGSIIITCNISAPTDESNLTAAQIQALIELQLKTPGSILLSGLVTRLINTQKTLPLSVLLSEANSLEPIDIEPIVLEKNSEDQLILDKMKITKDTLLKQWDEAPTRSEKNRLKIEVGKIFAAVEQKEKSMEAEKKKKLAVRQKRLDDINMFKNNEYKPKKTNRRQSLSLHTNTSTTKNTSRRGSIHSLAMPDLFVPLEKKYSIRLRRDYHHKPTDYLLNSSATRIQALWRGAIKRTGVLYFSSATKIQAFWRGCVWRMHSHQTKKIAATKFLRNSAAASIQALWRGVMAVSHVLHLYMKMEQEEEINAVVKLQARFRGQQARRQIQPLKDAVVALAKARAAEGRRRLKAIIKARAFDLTWDKLPPSEIPVPVYLSPTAAAKRKQRTEQKDSNGQMDDINDLEIDDAPDKSSPPRVYNNLTKLNQKLKQGNWSAKSEHLDLGLAYFAKSQLDPDVLDAVLFDKHLVENENLYDDESSDEETTGNKTRPSKHNLMTTTIGNDPNVLGADHSSDSSSEEDDGESDDTSEDEDGERFPSFQKFDTRSGNLGIRTMEPPPTSPLRSSYNQPNSEKSTVSGLPEMDFTDKHIPVFLQTTTTSQLRSSSKSSPSKSKSSPSKSKSSPSNVTYKTKTDSTKQSGKQSLPLSPSQTPSSSTNNGTPLADRQTSKIELSSKQDGNEKGDHTMEQIYESKRSSKPAAQKQQATNNNINSYDAYFAQPMTTPSSSMPPSSQSIHVVVPLQPSHVQRVQQKIHIVGETAPPPISMNMNNITTSLSEETPQSIADAYGLQLNELLYMNPGTMAKGIGSDEPLWNGTPIMIPRLCTLIKSPAVGANKHLIGARGTRSHRENATGITSRTSLLREASRLSSKHLLRMNGDPSDVMASYANDAPVSSKHEKQALDTWQRMEGSHLPAHKKIYENKKGSPEKHKTMEQIYEGKRSITSAPQRKWFLPYEAKVNLNSIQNKSALRSGNTSRGIREDGKRDRIAAERLARYNDREVDALIQIKHEADKARRELEKQYNMGPQHALLHGKHRNRFAGKLLRQQIADGNTTQFKRLSKYEHRSGGTENILEDVQFIARLLVVNPTTGSPTRKSSSRTPTAEPGSRLTLRIEAKLIGLADPSRPTKQNADQNVGAVIAVARGTLVDFEVFPAKHSGLRIVPSLSSYGTGPRGSGARRGNGNNTKQKNGNDHCRMLWKGNRCVVDVPLICGQGAVSGTTSVRLNILAGQKIAALGFRLEIMRSHRSNESGEKKRNRRRVEEVVERIPWSK